MSLERLYVIDVAEDEAAEPIIEPMRRAAALTEIVQHIFRIDTVDAHRVENEFHRLAVSPVLSRFRRLVYPHRYDALPAVIRAVRVDLDGDGQG